MSNNTFVKLILIQEKKLIVSTEVFYTKSTVESPSDTTIILSKCRFYINLTIKYTLRHDKKESSNNFCIKKIKILFE